MRLSSALALACLGASCGRAALGPPEPVKLGLVDLRSEDHVFHDFEKRDESQAPFIAALHATQQQKNQLQGFLEGNDTLAQGWRVVRDPHELIAPYLTRMYADSFAARPNALYDPYACRPHYDMSRNDTSRSAEQGAGSGSKNRTEPTADPEALAKHPFPARSYWSTVRGLWKAPAWRLHTDFVLPPSDAAARGAAAKLSQAGRKLFRDRQSDLLTLLFGPGYPGAEAGIDPGQELLGGKAVFQITGEHGYRDPPAKGKVHGIEGSLSLWPSPRRAARTPDTFVGKRDAESTPAPKADEPADTEEVKEALEEYRSAFKYERPDLKSEGSIDFDLDGLHFLDSGLIYMHALPTESSLYTDPRTPLSMMPVSRKHMPDDAKAKCEAAHPIKPGSTAMELSEAAAEAMLNTSLTAINATLASRVINNNASVTVGRTTEFNERTAFHNCSFHFYAHLTPSGSRDLRDSLAEMQSELRNPTGLSTIAVPQAEMRAFLYSPDCFLAVSLEPSRGMLSITEANKAIRYAVCLAVVLIIQSLLVTRQMDRSTTPSALSKISYISWGLQCLIDIGSFGAHVVAAIFPRDRSSMAMLTCAFLQATLFIALQYQHTLSMLVVQAPPSRPPAQESVAPVPVATDADGAAGAPVAAAPVTPTISPVQRLQSYGRQRRE